MLQTLKHGIIIIVQTVVQQAQPGGGCCLLTFGMTDTLSCSEWTVRPALVAWPAIGLVALTGCVRPFLSNLVSNIVQEMAQQVTHTQLKTQKQRQVAREIDPVNIIQEVYYKM